MNNAVTIAIAERVRFIEEAPQPEDWKKSQRLDLDVIATAADVLEPYRHSNIITEAADYRKQVRAITALDAWAEANQP